MKILMAHNYYREAGGEDESFRAESELLRERGNTVALYTRDNHEIQESGLLQRFQLARRTVWADDTLRELAALLSIEKPDVVHFQNTFPLISPSAYQACKEAGIPVVQSLRNYRLLCPNALFFRDGHPCEDCLGKTIPWPGVYHACYRDSRIQTTAVATMLSYHRLLKTWQNKVETYIALTEFSRQKYIQGGLPPERIFVKPNFVRDLGIAEEHEDYVVFVGRLSKEKGLLTLLSAWRNLRNIPLRIIGTGPLENVLASQIKDGNLHHIEISGFLPNREAVEYIKRARLLVFPTEWYETFGRVVIEAFSAGVPVVSSHIGAVAELVHDGITGLHFNPGDATELAAKVDWLWNHPEICTDMGRNARKDFEEKYTPERNYEILLDIYDRTMRQAKANDFH